MDAERDLIIIGILVFGSHIDCHIFFMNVGYFGEPSNV
jgi:hypothetical protein